MFTNWLTGTTGSSASTSTGTNRSHESTTTLNANGLSSLVGVNSLTNLNSNLMSTPPDVVLEVGPGPSTMRFMAHSIVLGMHSGYLRSAIRLDERSTATHHHPHHPTQHGADFVVYLSNVTPDQFAPLLSYMYTGYLDLNVENIFGVLLATHVLHMPRALEICRSYLARAQAEGYFGTNNTALATNSLNNSSHQNTSKIIRPIASKPQVSNFGFLPLAHSLQTTTLTPAPLVNRTTATVTNNVPVSTLTRAHDMESNKDEEDDIDVDECDKQSNPVIIAGYPNTNQEEDDEDVEVFIDTTSEDAEIVIETTEVKKVAFKKSNSEANHHNKHNKESNTTLSKSRHEKAHKKSHRSDKRRKAGATSSSGLQVAKAPIPASQLDNAEANKVIIDVASCDGPVRFKRILNTAYGHKPESCTSMAAASHLSGAVAGQERSLQSVSLSFHQQMAKTISQQQHLHNAEESENSETSNGSIGGMGANNNSNTLGAGGMTGSKASRKTQNEIFVCVYCKHTFKSQYCYQKHAKRHLNPLTLQATCVPSAEKRPTANEETKNPTTSATDPSHTIKGPNLQNIRPFVVRNSASTSSHSQPQMNQGCSTLNATSSEFLRREVRPLDMNVQYYPCKTCGCKFPSYYFVHKHRKMCHADEEAAASQQTSNNNATGGVATTTNTTTLPVAGATVATNQVAANNPTEEDELPSNAKNVV
ncbi:uncharacterized protein LOC106091684 [Stomoxys calcitrans]|uniref:uncharacterized protein LOC106091684 n=1 Tax=Stomoxys calcitrans TaxID=35570 RepID=UPI0027E2AEB6|nr:uncharacterized protein LOC106091684 [Stomoxys calcitrans]